MAIDFSALVERANAALEAPEQHSIIGARDGQSPRFDVYHAPFSVCSHKVRAVLVEKQIPFASHDIRMNLVAHDAPCPDNYKPGYVRLRLQAAAGSGLVHGFTGQSSVASEGLDPCVVPTLADREKEQVVVDSAKICTYLDQETDGTPLIPADLADAIAAQIALIDEAPHVGILYGASPSGDQRPERVAAGLSGVHDRKIKHLQALIAAHSDAPDLIAAYTAKIAKEKSAKSFIQEADTMVDAHARMKDHVIALDNQLKTHDGPWAMGEAYTMADIMWSVSLFRLKWIGLGRLWEDGDSAPRVNAYTARAFSRPAFQKSVINWPKSTPPSKHIEDTAPYAQALHETWRAIAARKAS
ncbi:MAG: glutathione S-transferase family protein [Pseudomonadota bacterium]